MQISRHWRLNANRYRLDGYEINGEKSVQARSIYADMQDDEDAALAIEVSVQDGHEARAEVVAA